MAVEIKCPACRNEIYVPDASNGKRSRCPQCGQEIDLPAGYSPEPAPVAAMDPAGNINIGDETRPEIVKKVRRTKTKSKLILWILIAASVPGIALVALILFLEYQDKTKYAEYEKEAKEVAEAKDSIKVSADDLWKAFDDNEESANAKYKGKVVEITGIIHRLTLDEITLSEKSDNAIPLRPVIVYMTKKNLEGMRRSKKGDMVTIRAKCIGRSSISIDVLAAAGMLVD